MLIFQNNEINIAGQTVLKKGLEMNQRLEFKKKELGKAQRIIIMLKLLGEGRRLSTNRIATMMGVSRRTIYRDINDLKDINVPLYYDRGEYRLDRNMWDAWSPDEIKQAIA